MSFPLFNSVTFPTSLLILRWSRKGKVTITDEGVLASILEKYDPNIISFSKKQGKALVQFSSVEIAQNITDSLNNGSITYNNSLTFHPSYCELTKEKMATAVPETIIQGELKDICEMTISLDIQESLQSSFSSLYDSALNLNPTIFRSDDNSIPSFSVVHSLFSSSCYSSYNACLMYSVAAASSKHIFLEHNQWGDRYVIFAIADKLNWMVEVQHDDFVYKYLPVHKGLQIEGQIRFCDDIRIKCESDTLIVILTTIRTTSCCCSYLDRCRDRLIHNSYLSTPTEIEKEHVYHVYDAIAGHFSSTRYSHWGGVTRFLDSVDVGSVVLDIGCGNGKYLSYVPALGRRYAMIGGDRSAELLHICRSRSLEVQLVDGLFVPYRADAFDAIISVAVVHHLSSNSLRRRMLAQMIKCLRIGGRCCVYVWAMEKDDSGDSTKSNRSYDKADVMVRWKLQKQFYDPAKDECEHSKEEEDGTGRVFERYYHMFREGELEWLVGTFDNVRILESWYERENWCVIFEKI